MSIKQLIFKNLKKNISNYYLYVFALIFTVALYFSFVTLQFDPAMDELKGSIKGGAAIRAASVLLIAIVSIFLIYANNIFIKRRSKEIGLFQLIGMTQNRIFRILTIENLFLFYGSLIIGIFIGFAFSKFIMMILFQITGVDAATTLMFSLEAFIQTIIVFTIIYVVIMLINYSFIKRQSILSLFRASSSTEENEKKVSFFEMLLGIFGIALIGAGYYVSTKLFGGDFVTMNELVLAMGFILGSVILGTYLFYKGSVRFIFFLIRKKKNGHLNIKDVVSLSSIMFRMKSNALLLTVITTLSALAIGLLTLSYISYYSAEKTAQDSVISDFAFSSIEDSTAFSEKLVQEQILFEEKQIKVIQVNANIRAIMKSSAEVTNNISNIVTIAVVSESSVDDVELNENETILSGYDNIMQKFIPLKKFGQIELNTASDVLQLNYLELQDDRVVPYFFTSGFPTAIVDEKTFEQLEANIDPTIQNKSNLYIGINLADKANIEKANDIFLDMSFIGKYDSQYDYSMIMKNNMGLIMFIVGFLGLTFLVTSGCILYFKQMGESEEEKPNYTILRKLGFTRADLHKGIQVKQLFNFGIPLIIGLSHSYFAVQSGWFLFGGELWTPMLIVMVLYTVLYSIFGLLSVSYYKKIIKEAL